MPAYEQDIHAWAFEQARLLREGRFELLDAGRLASEIEAVGRSERQALADDLAALLAALLVWQAQLRQRSAATTATLRARRKAVAYTLSESPSLRLQLHEPRWLDMVWARAVAQAVNETGLDCFPEQCPWVVEDEILAEGWRPE